MPETHDKYYIPHGTHWPIIISMGLFIFFAGVSVLLNGGDPGKWAAIAGVASGLVMIVRGCGDVSGDSEGVKVNFEVGDNGFTIDETNLLFAGYEEWERVSTSYRRRAFSVNSGTAALRTLAASSNSAMCSGASFAESP